jgi:hypothetical protein
MPSNVYCPFCGVILLPDPYSDDPASLQTRVRPWYAEVRGIYSTNTAFGYVTITGLGIIRCRNNLYAPLGNDLSYVDVGTEALEEWRLCEPSESRWCFGFHNSCWRLLLLRLGHGQDDYFRNETAIAESVFYQLYCTPCLEASSFEFGHDYEGAAQTHKSFGRPKAVDLSSHFYADPCAIPSVDDLKTTTFGFCKAPGGSLWKGRDGARPTTATVVGIGYHNEGGNCASSPIGSNDNRHLLPFPDDMREDRCKRLGIPKHHFFDALSPELKYEIFSYLSFGELLNIRLVCRNLALLATVDTLPQLYWRSRFLLGQEADFLFPRLTDKWDWSRLFFWTRASLRARLLPLVNRKRIRQLLEPIAALVDQEAVFRNGPYGSAFHPVQSQGSYFQLIDGESTGKPLQLMEIAGSFSGQLASIGADSPLDEGCRVLYHRTQPFMPPRQHHRQRIGISTVQIRTRSFISGINLFLPGDNVDRLVGYHIPAFQKWIEIPSSSHVKALCVAFCSEGLTGIKFIFTNSDSSGWVGDSNGPGIAQGILSIPERLDWYCLLAGLDCFKIVSLGLGKLTGHAGASVKFPSQGVMDSSCVQAHLWTPHPPRHEDLITSTLLPSQPSRAFEPRINIDFGGSRGLLLGSLTRLVFHMASSPYPLIGIEIFYSDGKSVLFGSNSGCEISFFVNGSNGERINQVGILEDSQRHHSTIGLGGLQVFSTYPPSICVRC